MMEFAFVGLAAPDRDLKRTQAVAEALKTNDASQLNPEEKATYDKLKAFESGDKSMYGEYLQNAPDGSISILSKLWNEKKVITNAYLGAPTETMGEKQATLDKMENEVFTKIIYGSLSIDQFDKFVDDWKKLGGDQITSEVNDWNAKQ